MFAQATFPQPIAQLKQYHDTLHMRFGGIRKPRCVGVGLVGGCLAASFAGCSGNLVGRLAMRACSFGLVLLSSFCHMLATTLPHATSPPRLYSQPRKLEAVADGLQQTVLGALPYSIAILTASIITVAQYASRATNIPNPRCHSKQHPNSQLLRNK